MKYALMALILTAAAYFSWQQFMPKLKPPPPPESQPQPQPAVVIEAPPIINQAELAKVIKSANDQDPKVRWEAIVFLDKMRVPDAFTVMFNKLQHDQDNDLRIKILQLLGKKGTPKLTIETNPDPLNPNPVVTIETPARQQQDKDIALGLIRAAKDPYPEVRIAALQAIDAFSDCEIASAVTDSLKDPDERVRLQALRTLNSLQDKKAALIEAERKRQEELRRQQEAAKK